MDAIGVILVGIMLLVWAWQNGQLKDTDEARYIALKDRPPEPWPGHAARPDADAVCQAALGPGAWGAADHLPNPGPWRTDVGAAGLLHADAVLPEDARRTVRVASA